MYACVLGALLVGQLGGAVGAPDRDEPVVDAAEAAKDRIERLREIYGQAAKEYKFPVDEAGKETLKLVERPVMRWATDNDWSGDVFVWTHNDLPAVVGCILSGPSTNNNRLAYHEFHLLTERPLPASAVHAGRRRWQPKSGLTREAVPKGPAPADSAPARLVQMRRLSRQFKVFMEADGVWELRHLPQPLYRYQNKEQGVIDGAIFTYVWSKGTDPEFILLLECRETKQGPQWQFAPVRFSNRALWLEHGEQELWRVEGHREPGERETDLVYTTAYANVLRPLDLQTPAQPE